MSIWQYYLPNAVYGGITYLMQYYLPNAVYGGITYLMQYMAVLPT